MAKIIKMNPIPKGNKDFYDFYQQLPKEQQEMLDAFGISSFTDLMGLSTMLGLDVNKIIEHDMKHPEQSLEDLPPVEEFMLEETNPSNPTNFDFLNETYEEGNEDEDPFMLPERVFIGDNPVEYHIRLKLNNAPLPIWRELKVPSNITLEVFHFIIMEAMGWENRHLHLFRKGDKIFKNTACINEDMNMGFFGIGSKRVENTNDYALSQLLQKKGDRMKYEYDFGDSWEHEFWLKGIREYSSEEIPWPIVLKCKGACPPEDCGGVWGYEELLRIHAKKRHTKEEKERLKWYHMYYPDFNPEERDLEIAQAYMDELWEELIITE